MMYRKMLVLIVAAMVSGAAWVSAQSGGKQLSAQDFVEIQQLYTKYNWALDSGDAEGYASTFTPDGVFNNNVGHDAIVKFANTFHGERRSKRMVASSLDGIAGLGEARKKQLVKAMGGVNAVKRATLEELQALSFLPDAVAQAQ